MPEIKIANQETLLEVQDALTAIDLMVDDISEDTKENLDVKVSTRASQEDMTAVKTDVSSTKSDIEIVKTLLGQPNPTEEDTETVMNMLLKILNKPSGGGSGKSNAQQSSIFANPDLIYKPEGTATIANGGNRQFTCTGVNNGSRTRAFAPITTKHGVFIKVSNQNSISRLDPNTLEVAAVSESFTGLSFMHCYDDRIYLVGTRSGLSGTRIFRLDPVTLDTEAYSTITGLSSNSYTGGFQFTAKGLYFRVLVTTVASWIYRLDIDSLETLSLSGNVPANTHSSYLTGFAVNRTYAFIFFRNSSQWYCQIYNASTLEVVKAAFQFYTVAEVNSTTTAGRETTALNTLFANESYVFFNTQYTSRTNTTTTAVYYTMSFVSISQMLGTSFPAFVQSSNVFNITGTQNSSMISTLNLAQYVDRYMLLVPKEAEASVAFADGTRLIERNRFRVVGENSSFIGTDAYVRRNLQHIKYATPWDDEVTMDVSMLGMCTDKNGAVRSRIALRYTAPPSLEAQYHPKAEKTIILDYVFLSDTFKFNSFTLEVVADSFNASLENFHTSADGSKIYAITTDAVYMYKVWE